MSLTGYTYKEQVTIGLDANDLSSVTPALDIKNNLNISFSVLEKTGSHSNHVFTFQRSTDNVNWDDTSGTITAGTTYTVKAGITATVRYMRIKCTTVEGSASTVDIVINAK